MDNLDRRGGGKPATADTAKDPGRDPDQGD